MIGFLAFIAGLFLGILITCAFSGYYLCEILSDRLTEAKETIESCNVFLEGIEDRAIEVKMEL